MARFLIPQLICFGLLVVSMTARAGDIAGMLNNYDRRSLHNALIAGEGIVGRVNKDVISISQLRELVGRKEKEAYETLKGAELDENIERIEVTAVNELVNRTLILQEFKAEGRTIPEASIDKRIQQIIDNRFGGDRPAFLHWLDAEGYTLEMFRESSRDDIIIEQMRKQAGEGTTNEAEAKQKEDAWLQGLRKKAHVKLY